MKITKTTLPKNSILNSTKYEYVDSFQGDYLDAENQINCKDIAKAFFTSTPNWTVKLFELRNKIVSIFGLKISGNTKNKKELLDAFNCEPNEKLGLFRVYYRNENEVILGEDDKHLDFRVSLYKEENPNDKERKKLTISTTVQFNNWFGKLYFLPVKPFHRLIVPIMLKGLIGQIERKKTNG